MDSVCQDGLRIWFDVGTDDPHDLIRAADTMRNSSPPEELTQYRDWWVAALERTSPTSDELELVEGVVERTAAHPLPLCCDCVRYVRPLTP